MMEREIEMQCGKKSLIDDNKLHDREMWPSRSSFLFNAIGTTVGISSMWRFPALAYKYGGGSFILPYLLALVLIGYPLLLLEIGMGQYFQTGDIGVFGSVDKRLRGVGIASVLSGLIVIGYYIPLLSWLVKGYVESFGEDNEMSASDALDFFFLEVIGMASLGDDLKPTRVVWSNVGYVISIWCCIGIIVASGVKYVGRVAYVTMALLCFNISILLIRAVTIESAINGIQKYAGGLDFSSLIEQPEVWSVAVVEIFFTLGGCTFGLMTAMASHCPKDFPASQNASIIALSNIFFNFVAAVVMFSVMDKLEVNGEGFIDIADTFIAGPAMLYSSYPGGLPAMPTYWFKLVFLNIFLLGIDNAFAFVGTIRDAISDSTIGKNVSDNYAIGITIGCCILSSLVYTSDAGLIFLDVVDFYINYVMLLVGTYKAFSAGWMYGMNDQVSKYGKGIVYMFIATTFGSLLASCIFVFVAEGSRKLIGIALYFILYGCGIYIVVGMITSKDMMVVKVLYDLYFGNVLDLRNKLETSVGKIPSSWPFLLKHFIPQVLIILFMNVVFTKNDEANSDFAHFRGYSSLFQALGLSVVSVVVAVFTLGVIKPDLYKYFASQNERDICVLHISSGKPDERKICISDDVAYVL